MHTVNAKVVLPTLTPFHKSVKPKQLSHLKTFVRSQSIRQSDSNHAQRSYLSSNSLQKRILFWSVGIVFVPSFSFNVSILIGFHLLQ
jgi:hypothetical protein